MRTLNKLGRKRGHNPTPYSVATYPGVAALAGKLGEHRGMNQYPRTEYTKYTLLNIRKRLIDP